MLRKMMFRFVFVVALVGCAGVQRSCQSGCASSLGGDYLITQFDYMGKVVRCWKLTNGSVSNEEHSDGIYWRDHDGHIIHISGWYNFALVENTSFKTAGEALGVDEKLCTGGVYDEK